jgi:ubiquinone/menaquinone biosynthesis C-methylase UbiE
MGDSDGGILDDAEANSSEFEHSFLDDSFIGFQAKQLEDFESPPVRSRAQSAAKTLGNVDPFANINACTSEQIERLARILEIRGAQPRQVKMRAACFRAAGLSRGMSVLELGCGTGVVTRELAQFAGGSGRVVGLDVSPQLLDMARRTRPPADARIEYVHGNAYKLEFPSNSFDASCAITLLAHIEDLDKVVKEMIRVTRRTVMLLDQDYQTLVFENSNTRLTRAILQCGADYNVVDGWCGRKLAGLLVRHRLRDVHCWPFVYSERESQSYLITIAERFAALATSRGIVTEEEARIWLQELYDRCAEGTFYASLNYYFSFGTKAGARTS